MVAYFMTGYLGKTAKAPVKTPEEQQEIDAEEVARIAAIRKKQLKVQLLVLGGWAMSMGLLTLYRVLRNRKQEAKNKEDAAKRQAANAQVIQRRNAAFRAAMLAPTFGPHPAYGPQSLPGPPLPPVPPSDVEQVAKYFSNKELKKRRTARGQSWPPTDMVDIRGKPVTDLPPGHWDIP